MECLGDLGLGYGDFPVSANLRDEFKTPSFLDTLGIFLETEKVRNGFLPAGSNGVIFDYYKMPWIFQRIFCFSKQLTGL
jgi:hypothetical protein